MNCDKILAINDDIATVSLLPARHDNSTCISLQLYKLDTFEAGLSASGVPVTCNIAQQRVVVCCCAEAVENKTGLYRCFLLFGPRRIRSASRSVWLYTVDNREITLFREFRLPTSFETRLSDVTLQILDGPTVIFVEQSNVYVATSDGVVQIYPTNVDGVFQYLTGWVQNEYLLVIGLAASGLRKSKKDSSANQSAVLSLCINTLKQLIHCSCDTLVPDVYIGMLLNMPSRHTH